MGLFKRNRKPVFYRQGDVLLRRNPLGTFQKTRYAGKPLAIGIEKPLILAYGEVTGHSHAIEPDPGVIAWSLRDSPSGPLGAAFSVLKREGVELKHEEHAPILLPPGDYEVIHQVEYDPRLHSRAVLD